MDTRVKRTEYGYYELEKREKCMEFYQNEYFQNNRGLYQNQYSVEEIEYFEKQNMQKHYIYSKVSKPKKTKRLLDVGCGEGWTLKYFSDLKTEKWDVLGIDYSSYGLEQHNKDFLEGGEFFQGDIGTFLSTVGKDEKFDFISMDNVLEHVDNPIEQLKLLTELANEKCVLWIKVPNDFSKTQRMLMDKGYIDHEFWVVEPDHNSYFNKAGLINLAENCGWHCERVLGTYPIDFNLFNDRTNYIKNKEVGKACYHAGMEIEKMMLDISIEDKIRIDESLGSMGLGRELIGVFMLKEGRTKG